MDAQSKFAIHAACREGKRESVQSSKHHPRTRHDLRAHQTNTSQLQRSSPS